MPWDDDVDLAVPLATDTNRKMQRVAKALLGTGFALQEFKHLGVPTTRPQTLFSHPSTSQIVFICRAVG